MILKSTMCIALLTLSLQAENNVSKFVADGEILFKKCVSCHGQKAEKKALNKSKILVDMTQVEIEKALRGYKEGTYGGSMKGLMTNQVKNMTQKDIYKVVFYIESLKKRDYNISPLN